jgi:hypothetical protein
MFGFDWSVVDVEGVSAWFAGWWATGLALGGVGALLASLVRRR